MLVDHGLELLSEEDAWGLLAGGDVGRIGLSMGAMPVIFPVNYVVVDHSIVFNTAPGSKLSAAAAGAVVAFEVDDYERQGRAGWSVLVVGRSEVVHNLDVTFKVLAAQLQPYADGVRSSLVRIRPEFVSGRRLVHDQHDGGRAMNSMEEVYVADWVNQPFADVCGLLAKASRPENDQPAGSDVVVGPVVRVSGAMASVMLQCRSASCEDTTELRILPVWGGRDAVTELLLISRWHESSSMPHEVHVERAWSVLKAIEQTLEQPVA